jgi:argininosuccinate synthase
VIAPWREWDLNVTRIADELCEAAQYPIDFAKAGKKSPYSMDANLLHISYEGGGLEDPWWEPEEDMWRWTVSARKRRRMRRNTLNSLTERATSSPSTAKEMSAGDGADAAEPARWQARHRPS